MKRTMSAYSEYKGFSLDVWSFDFRGKTIWRSVAISNHDNIVIENSHLYHTKSNAINGNKDTNKRGIIQLIDDYLATYDVAETEQ